jgi:glycosyltransferase involved in cell wall biosynthesis
MLVSILTPSFNQEQWLSDNLRSVANQSHCPIEHIVMDGGSTDGSVQLLKTEASGRIRWKSEADRGQSHALNKALAESRGEIIGWLNSDDTYFDEQVISDVVDVFRRRPDIDVVYGHAALTNAAGLILQMIWVPPFSYRLLKLHNYVIQPAAFVRRSALGDVIADEEFDSAMDRELWLRLGEEHGFTRLNRVVATDRHYPERKSHARPDLARIDRERLHELYATPDESSLSARWALKASKILCRLAGLRLVTESTRRRLAFHGSTDGLLRLALRQVAVRRASMPIASLNQ